MRREREACVELSAGPCPTRERERVLSLHYLRARERESERVWLDALGACLAHVPEKVREVEKVISCRHARVV